jgi:aerobic carbon-monoxide dehydrogenase small subunit
MTRLDLIVNGRLVSADVEPRTHLADFLRETLLLTGTHLGCEHGVCGACTVLLNDEPVRSCLTYAALCDGAAVRSVEGLEDDPVTIALRGAFSAEHALQCGYCTPGMLVTARDIVLRLPDADDDRVRLELAGNLCRCTGYNGIVKAIRRVLDAGIAEPVWTRASVPVVEPIEALPPVPAATIGATPGAPASGAPTPGTPSSGTPNSGAEIPGIPAAGTPAPGTGGQSGNQGLRETLRIGASADTVWAAIQDPGFVAGCVPGARLTAVDGQLVAGEMLASLGPIQARFAGTATLVFDPETRSGRLAGEGSDAGGGTRLSGEAAFAVVPDGPDASRITLDIAYALRGKLAQFGRGPVVAVFAAEIAATVARNLESRLRGADPPSEPERLSGGRLMIRVLWNVLRRWVKGRG